MRARLFFLLGLVVPSVACDQATKVLAETHLKGEPAISLGSIFHLAYAENPGAFLGLGQDLPDAVRAWIFGAGVALMLAALALAVVRAKQLSLAAAAGLALILAGGAGNLIDRTSRPGGRVVDFMQLRAGPLRTGIFNVADLHIVAGAIFVAAGGRQRQRGTPTDGPAA